MKIFFYLWCILFIFFLLLFSWFSGQCMLCFPLFCGYHNTTIHSCHFYKCCLPTPSTVRSPLKNIFLPLLWFQINIENQYCANIKDITKNFINPNVYVNTYLLSSINNSSSWPKNRKSMKAHTKGLHLGLVARMLTLQ